MHNMAQGPLNCGEGRVFTCGGVVGVKKFQLRIVTPGKKRLTQDEFERKSRAASLNPKP